jgi:hypothetical protein
MRCSLSILLPIFAIAAWAEAASFTPPEDISFRRANIVDSSSVDLLHVLEKLWKAAYVFHAEGSLGAQLWVLDPTLRILFGEVGQVVKGIRQSVTKRGSSGPSKGWPIASGPIEGACKNLIKDRMERSGMRWTEEMAEAIVQLRAIYSIGDFDRYWSFHIAKHQQRLHPGHWSVVLK